MSVFLAVQGKVGQFHSKCTLELVSLTGSHKDLGVDVLRFDLLSPCFATQQPVRMSYQ